MTGRVFEAIRLICHCWGLGALGTSQNDVGATRFQRVVIPCKAAEKSCGVFLVMMQFFYIMDLPNYGKPYKVTKCNEILLMIQKS